MAAEAQQVQQEQLSPGEQTFSQLLPPGDAVKLGAMQKASVSDKAGVEWGKGREINFLWILRLFQKPEAVADMVRRVNKLRAEHVISDELADITLSRLNLHRPQEYLLAAFTPGGIKRFVIQDHRLRTLGASIGFADEYYHPVMVAIDEELQAHTEALLSRGSQNEYNTMKNVFDIFTTTKIDQKAEQKVGEQPKPKKKGWLPW